MKKYALLGAMLACVASGMSNPVQAQAVATRIGVISYWGTNASLYNQLPGGSLALINPDSGIFQGQTTTLVPDLAAYKSIVDQQTSRNVRLIGYVPTGYFNHSCNQMGVCQTWERIEAQVRNYFQQMPNLKGIFFDEAAPANWNCAAFVNEYQQLRTIVKKYRADATIAFNAGVPDNCVVTGTQAGEIAVLFESDTSSYTSQAQPITNATATARAKGVLTWHLVHSVPAQADMERVVQEIKTRGADYGYITNIGGNWQAGENTWGSLPPYWTRETELLNGSSTTAPGVNWGNLNRKIVNKASYLCLSATSGHAEQQVCTSAASWDLVYQNASGQNFYKLTYGGLCLTAGSSNVNAVTWESCTLGDRQLFAMREAGGLVYFTAKTTGNALTMDTNSAGSWASAWPYSAAPSQQFYFQD